MRHTLKRHPDSLCEAVTRIDVEVTRAHPGALTLRYIVTGKIAGVLLAPPSAPMRTDELWRTTCFEAFLLANDNAYSEFNLAPSTAWAAYRFAGYRSGMEPAPGIAAPRIGVQSSAERFELTATLELPKLSDLDRLAISAVIEETNGRKSYWALAHPPGKPDFHHAAGFTLDLAQAEHP